MVKRKRDSKESAESAESIESGESVESEENKYLLHQAASEGNYPAVLFLVSHGFISSIDQVDDQGKTPLDKVSEGYEELLANKYACDHHFEAMRRNHVKTFLSCIRRSIKKCKTNEQKEELITKANTEVNVMIAKRKGLLDC